jgi:hypothetical protein
MTAPHTVPPEMHTAKLMEAVRQLRPFSIWRAGELIGRTYNDRKRNHTDR